MAQPRRAAPCFSVFFHRSYSAQTRSQNEEKNPPPKPYLPLQTRTRHRRSHRSHVPMSMRGNTPPTMCSPPHQSRPTENPPNRQPATVGEEELDGRDSTSRLVPGYNSESCASSFQGNLNIRIYICTRLKFYHPLLSRSKKIALLLQGSRTTAESLLACQ